MSVVIHRGWRAWIPHLNDLQSDSPVGSAEGSTQLPCLALPLRAPLIGPLVRMAEQLVERSGPVAEPSPVLGPTQNQQLLRPLRKGARVTHSEYFASKIQERTPYYGGQSALLFAGLDINLIQEKGPHENTQSVSANIWYLLYYQYHGSINHQTLPSESEIYILSISKRGSVFLHFV